MPTLALHKHGTIRDKVRGDIQRLPFREDCIDLVTANMVAEHVQDAGKLLTEIHRVLRPGGIFLFHTPNLFSYATIIACLIPGFIKIKLIRFLQGRNEEDVFSTYYRFNTLGRATALARRTGFNISEFKFVESSAQTVMLGPIVILELLLIRLLRL